MTSTQLANKKVDKLNRQAMQEYNKRLTIIEINGIEKLFIADPENGNFTEIKPETW